MHLFIQSLNIIVEALLFTENNKKGEGWEDWFSDTTQFLFYLIYGPWLQVTLRGNNESYIYVCVCILINLTVFISKIFSLLFYGSPTNIASVYVYRRFLSSYQHGI